MVFTGLPTDQEIMCYLVGWLCPEPEEVVTSTSYVDTIVTTCGIMSGIYLLGRGVKLYLDYKAAVARDARAGGDTSSDDEPPTRGGSGGSGSSGSGSGGSRTSVTSGTSHHSYEFYQ